MKIEHHYVTQIVPINCSGWFPEKVEHVDYLLSLPVPTMYINGGRGFSVGLGRKSFIPVKKTITHYTYKSK